jgi:hypothetical protein
VADDFKRGTAQRAWRCQAQVAPRESGVKKVSISALESAACS